MIDPWSASWASPPDSMAFGIPITHLVTISSMTGVRSSVSHANKCTWAVRRPLAKPRGDCKVWRVGGRATGDGRRATSQM